MAHLDWQLTEVRHTPRVFVWMFPESTSWEGRPALDTGWALRANARGGGGWRLGCLLPDCRHHVTNQFPLMLPWGTAASAVHTNEPFLLHIVPDTATRKARNRCNVGNAVVTLFCLKVPPPADIFVIDVHMQKHWTCTWHRIQMTAQNGSKLKWKNWEYQTPRKNMYDDLVVASGQTG